MTAARYVYSVLTLLTTSVHSLSVNAGSPCFDLCNGDSPTTSSDIVCTDSDFANTSQGQILESCLSCLQVSSYRAGFRSDSVLFLYYLSLTQQTCLVSSAPDPIASCDSQCAAVETAVDSQDSEQPFQSPAGYCSSNNYNSNAETCGTCLQSQEGTVILGNFVYVSAEACTQLPGLVRGNPITFAGNVFNTTPTPTSTASSAISVTGSSRSTATASSRSASSGPITSSETTTHSSASPITSPTSIITLQTSTTATASSTSTPSASNTNSNTRCLSKAAIAAIATLSALVLLALLLALFLFLRKRHQSSWKQMKEPPNSLHPDMSDPVITMSGAIPVTSFRNRSLRSLRSLKSSLRDFSPATAEWWYAANPKNPADLSALPQKMW